MIPSIYKANEKNFEHNGLGLLKDLISIYVEKERNNIWQLVMEYPVEGAKFERIKKENIIKCDSSPVNKSQLFRIDYISGEINGKVKVYAKHIAIYDLSTDILVDAVESDNLTCEGALNKLFANSLRSKHYKGYSNISNSNKFSMDKSGVLEAIVGKRGSIIDTFGNGADIVIDNFEVGVYQNYGNKNNVLVAYSKNLDGFKIEEDMDGLCTVLYPYAKYTEEGSDKEVIVYGDTVSSSRVGDYNYEYPKWKDFSDQFGEDEIPTKETVSSKAKYYMNTSRCDIPLLSYKISFIPLESTEEYKDLGILSQMDLFDTVIIHNEKYNLIDQARIIKAKYDPYREKYLKLELGDSRSTLSGIIGETNDNVSNVTEKVEDITNTDGIKNPDTLPAIPTVSTKAGFAVIELTWTYANKSYYNYEVYASQTRDFIPNAFDLIYKGQASTFLHEVVPEQTWYYRVRAVNTYGRATEFSEQVSNSSFKMKDGTTYIENAAIKDALIGTLNADRGWIGKFSATYIDARNLKVTDGNGDITFYIDSYGYVKIQQGVIEMDKDGIWVNHSDGSRTNLNGTALNFYDSEGALSARISNGTFKFTTPEGKLVGFFGKSKWNGTEDYVSAINCEHGHEVGIGYMAEVGAEFYSTPFVVASKDVIRKVGDVEQHLTQGLNLSNAKCSGAIKLVRSITYDPVDTLLFEGPNREFCGFGYGGLILGVSQSGSLMTNFKIEYDSSATSKGTFKTFGDFNFNNYQLTNYRSTYALEPQSTYTKSLYDSKMIMNSYQCESMQEGDIRLISEETYITTEEYNYDDEGNWSGTGKYNCYCEFPIQFSENIRNEYHINIGKNSWGDYRIIEKTPYYFILESEKDSFSFTYEIVAQRIETPYANSIIANNSVDLEPTPLDENILVPIEKGGV